MRAWPAAALAAVLAVILWSQPRAGGRRDRGAVDPGAGAAAAALRRATGIDPAAPVWGAPFRELAALYDGADPPLETFGVSAKLFSNGKAATARYYVALELPGSGGHLPRDAQRRAAARTAAALKAPPLVDAWLAVLAAEAPPPVYGFGVDADAGAAKLYVQNRDGAALPQLPAAAEAALPPVFSNGTREPPRTLSLEWRVGEATTALRQYAVGTTSDGTPRPVRDSFLAVGEASWPRRSRRRPTRTRHRFTTWPRPASSRQTARRRPRAPNAQRLVSRSSGGQTSMRWRLSSRPTASMRPQRRAGHANRRSQDTRSRIWRSGAALSRSTATRRASTSSTAPRPRYTPNQLRRGAWLPTRGRRRRRSS